MANFKNYGIGGVGPSIQLGKGGGVLAYSTTISDGTSTGTAPAFSLSDNTQSTLIRLQAGTPLQYNDVTTKLYVDNLVQGLNIKEAVYLASSTSTNIPLSGTTPLIVDGVQASNGNRILLKDQTDQTQNGIYTLTISGTSYTLARSIDASNSSEASTSNTNLTGGSFVFVTGGSTNESTGWVISSPEGAINLGTDKIIWTQFSSAGVTQPGAGLIKSGTVFSVNTDNSTLYVNSTSTKLSVKSSSSAGNVLISNGLASGNPTDASWGSLDLSNPYTVGSSVLAPTNGGTGINSYKTGDIIVGDATANTLKALSIGADYTILGVDSTGALSYNYASQLRDSSGNLGLQVNGSDAPVNYFVLSNSDAADNVVLSTATTGTNTDAGITISPMGNGLVVAKTGYDALLQSDYSSISDETFITKGALNKRVGVVDTSMISNGTNNDSGTDATSGNTYVATNADGYTDEAIIVSSDKIIAEFVSSTDDGVAVNGEHLKVTSVTGELQLQAVDTAGTDNVDIRLIPQSSGKVYLGATGAGLIQAEDGYELDIQGGNSSSTADAGALVLRGGSASSNNLQGGNVVIRGGAANGSGQNGEVYIQDYNEQNIVEFSATSSSSNASNWLQIINSPNSSDVIDSSLVIQPSSKSGSANVSIVLGGKGTGLIRVADATSYNANLSTNTPDAFATVGYLNSVMVAATITTGAGLVNDSNVFKLAVGANTIGVDSSGNAIVNSDSTKNHVLLSSGTVGVESVWGSLPLADSNAVSGVLPATHGGTGQQTYSAGDMLIGSSTGALNIVSIDSVNKVLTSTGTSAGWQYPSTLLDGNGNTVVSGLGSTNPVNNLTITNAAVAGAPTLGVTGSDTDISILIQPKGAGIISAPVAYNTSMINSSSTFTDEALTTKGYVDQAVLGHTDPMARLQTISSGWAATMNIGSVLPNITGKNVMISSVRLVVNTAISGGGASEARIYAGSNVVMNNDENDVTTIGTYVADLPMSFTSNNVQLTVQFFKSDGTTTAIPTAGNITVYVDYKLM